MATSTMKLINPLKSLEFFQKSGRQLLLTLSWSHAYLLFLTTLWSILHDSNEEYKNETKVRKTFPQKFSDLIGLLVESVLHSDNVTIASTKGCDKR